ncbi:MAG: radical SAM protein [Deltaproteobacteria bacterium]|nr:radical SAM protein [Deltaproteobacteria bacterium]
MKTIFGPVPSRRLGFSLGVDIIPYKTCSFDCIYCELGKTDCKTIEPVEVIQTEAVLKELEGMLSASPLTLDYITVSGSGEPTLHPQLGLILQEIRKIARVPIALLTNGSLLFKEEVLERVLAADVVVPSLDAPDRKVFQTVNRPHPSLTFDQLIDGLIKLGKAKGPRVWLEVLLLRGINDTPEQIEGFGKYIKKINPEKIHLNTVVRPPVESYAAPVPDDRLKEIRKTWGPRAEIIAGPSQDKVQAKRIPEESKICDLVARRPCTAEDIAQFLGLSLEETVPLLDRLIQKKKITYESFNQQGFYRGL